MINKPFSINESGHFCRETEKFDGTDAPLRTAMTKESG